MPSECFALSLGVGEYVLNIWRGSVGKLFVDWIAKRSELVWLVTFTFVRRTSSTNGSIMFQQNNQIQAVKSAIDAYSADVIPM